MYNYIEAFIGHTFEHVFCLN